MTKDTPAPAVPGAMAMTEERDATIRAHLERHGMLPEEYADELFADRDRLRAQVREGDGLREALSEIATGAFHGASTAAMDGPAAYAAKLQEIAAAALARMLVVRQIDEALL